MKKSQVFSFGHTNFERPIKHPGGHFDKLICQRGGAKGKVGAGDSFNYHDKVDDI